MAERYCNTKGLQFNWPQFRALASVIEIKVNSTAQTIEAIINNRQNTRNNIDGFEP